MLPIKIIGSGIYAPGEPISNAELKRLAGIEFDQEKIREKLGIESRHIAHLREINESTADFAEKAALQAIDDAGIKPSQVGLFIVATDTPEYITPATAILLQGRIQGRETWSSAYDMAASCASFTIALDNAVRIMTTEETIEYAVVVGVYNMPAFFRSADEFAYPIFADGAGAVILKRDERIGAGYINGQLLTDGTQWDYIGVYAGGTKSPITKKIIDENKHGLINLKPLPGDRNVRLWPMVIEKLLKKSSMHISQVDHFIFTQINRSVIINVLEILGQPVSKTTFVMDRYGYTGAACVPMAYHHARKEARIKKNDVVMFIASGAGLSVGSNLFIES